MNRMSGWRVIAFQSFGKKYGLVLAEINEIYCAYCVNHVIQFLASSRHFPVTFSQPSCNFQGIFRIRSGVSVGRRFGDAHLIAGWGTKCRICNPSICRRHFTIHSLTFWLPGMRHEVPNWWPRCAILPSITLLIAKDEAWNAKFMPILAIPPLICPFWLLSEAHAECQIGSGYIAFMPFFRVFSWTFLPSRSLSCLSVVVFKSIISYFISI